MNESKKKQRKKKKRDFSKNLSATNFEVINYFLKFIYLNLRTEEILNWKIKIILTISLK